MQNAFLEEENAGDSLDKADAILDFLQHWTCAKHDSELSNQENYGLCMILEAARLLIAKGNGRIDLHKLAASSNAS